MDIRNLCLFILLASSYMLSAQATFNVTLENEDEWNKKAGAEAAFNYALGIWANAISSNVVINVQADFKKLDNNVLGYAAPNGFAANFSSSDSKFKTGVFYAIPLAEKMHGANLNGSSSDIICAFN